MKDKLYHDKAKCASNLKKNESMSYSGSRNYSNYTGSKKLIFSKKLILSKKTIEQITEKKCSNIENNKHFDEKFVTSNLLDKDLDEMSCLESKFLNAELGESYPNDETGTFISQKNEDEKSSCEIFDFSNSKIIKNINDNVSSILKSDLNEQSSRLLYKNCNENNESTFHFNNINKVKIFNTKQSILTKNLINTSIKNYTDKNKHSNCFNIENSYFYISSDLFGVNNINN